MEEIIAKESNWKISKGSRGRTLCLYDQWELIWGWLVTYCLSSEPRRQDSKACFLLFCLYSLRGILYIIAYGVYYSSAFICENFSAAFFVFAMNSRREFFSSFLLERIEGAAKIRVVSNNPCSWDNKNITFSFDQGSKMPRWRLNSWEKRRY